MLALSSFLVWTHFGSEGVTLPVHVSALPSARYFGDGTGAKHGGRRFMVGFILTINRDRNTQELSIIRNNVIWRVARPRNKEREELFSD